MQCMTLSPETGKTNPHGQKSVRVIVIPEEAVAERDLRRLLGADHVLSLDLAGYKADCL